MLTIFQIFTVVLIFLASHALALDWFDYETGDYVIIQGDTLIKHGETIQYFDYNTNTYHTGEVEFIGTLGTTTQVDVYDNNDDKSRTFKSVQD
jgi:ribosomal protein L21E